MSTITTHVLDTSRGRPAAGISVTLDRRTASGWTGLGAGVTNADGRIKDLLPADQILDAGIYRLTFQTGPYFDALGIQGFYPEVPIHFEIRVAGEHYHVPLLLNPFGYSTYRGS